MVHATRVAGAVGAKLTGAGGGGCIIALSELHRHDDVMRAIKRCKGIPHVINISHQGVNVRRIEWNINPKIRWFCNN